MAIISRPFTSMATRKPRKKASTAKTKATAKAGAVRRARAAAEVADEAGTGGTLVIVEAPAKAKTIGKYLGRGYRVRATVGHIMDLPEKKLGIDVEVGFKPDLVPIPGKVKSIA